MLTGTLITAAGFLPIATAKSAPANTPLRSSPVVGDRAAGVLGGRGRRHALPRLQAAAGLRRPRPSQPRGCGPTHGRPGRLARHGDPRGLRHRSTAASARWSPGASAPQDGDRRDARRCSSASLARSASSSSSSSRRRPGRNCWSTCGCRRALRSRATESEVKKLEAMLATGLRRRQLRQLRRQRQSPRFYLPLDQQLPHANFAQFVVTDQDIAGARARCATRLLRAVRAATSRRCAARVCRLENGPPVGFPVQFRVLGRGHPAALRAIGARGRRGDARQSARDATSISTGTS